jgi:hypothetical protein
LLPRQRAAGNRRFSISSQFSCVFPTLTPTGLAVFPNMFEQYVCKCFFSGAIII